MPKENQLLPNLCLSRFGISFLFLDLLCLFLAPLAGGAGNYLTLFFSANLHWDANQIGILLAIMSISLGVAQIPAGVLIDRISKLKQIIIIALSVLVIGWLSILFYPNLYSAGIAQLFIGASCAVFMPAVASITLALVGVQNFDRRLGRNGVFSHAGNVLTALCVALAIAWLGSRAVLLFLIVFALLAILSTLGINSEYIHYEYLRKKEANHNSDNSVHPLLGGFASLFASRQSIFFSIGALFYTFADASMLPLMVQRISSGGSKRAALHVPLALFITELVMIPVCYIAGRRAHFGRKPLLIIAYCLLTIRGFCFTIFSQPDIVVALQALDGISAGIFGLMLTLVISDFSINSGRFNATLTTMGMLFTLVNSLSYLVFGFLVEKLGYPAAFASMALSAATGATIIWVFVPETLRPKTEVTNVH